MSARGAALVVAVLSALVIAWRWMPDSRSQSRAAAALDEPRTRSGASAALSSPPELGDGAATDAKAASAPVEEAGVAPAPVREPSSGAEDDLVGCTVYGRVLGSDGLPLRQPPSVSASDASGQFRVTRASDDGHFALTGIPPGAWTLSAQATGYREFREELVLESARPVVRRDVALERAVVLSIRLLTPQGEPLTDALGAIEPRLAYELRPMPVATLESPGAAFPDDRHLRQDRLGIARFEDVGSVETSPAPGVIGALVLAVDLPVHVSLAHGTHVVATRLVEPGTDEVAFVLDPDTLLRLRSVVKARLVSAVDRSPLAGEVVVGEGDRTVFMVRQEGWEQALRPGTHRLVFRAPGHAYSPCDVALAPGQTLDLGTLELPPELTIEGHVVDEEGRAVRAQLVLGERPANGHLRFEELEYLTDESGYFRVFGLRPGSYVLRTAEDEAALRAADGAHELRASTHVPVQTYAGSVQAVEVRAVRAGILLLTGFQEHPPSTLCKILDADGDALRWSGFLPGFVPRFALPPGAYTFVLCDEDWNELERHAVEIGAGVTELDLAR